MKLMSLEGRFSSGSLLQVYNSTQPFAEKSHAAIAREGGGRHNLRQLLSRGPSGGLRPPDPINKLGDFCMNKKLLVAAVAGALAVPGIALAQVTITGKVGGMWQSVKYSGATGVGRGAVNQSSSGISDNISTLTFKDRKSVV